MIAVARVLVLVWAGSAVLFGAVGLAAAPWELDVAFGTSAVGAAFLNQYRFLRGVEMGAGLLFFVLRREVLDAPRVGWLFVAVAGLGALGRVVSVVADGPPPTWMWGLLAIEGGAAVAVALHHQSRRP